MKTPAPQTDEQLRWLAGGDGGQSRAAGGEEGSGGTVSLIFGEFWDAPVCDDGISVPTPVGRPCLWCGEAIEDGDQGQLMGTVRLDGSGEPTPGSEPIHRECALRSVMGSVGHMKGTCSCSGGGEEDPPGLSRREGAIALWRAVTEGIWP